MTTAIGLFQVRQLEPDFATAEWGFALGSAFWGTGMFMDGARMVVDFAFETLGVRRLEARAAVANGRGNGALRKLGAVQEGVLRRSFLKNGQCISTRCCGRSSARNGGRPRPCGGRASFTRRRRPRAARCAKLALAQLGRGKIPRLVLYVCTTRCLATYFAR